MRRLAVVGIYDFAHYLKDFRISCRSRVVCTAPKHINHNAHIQAVCDVFLKCLENLRERIIAERLT